MKSKLLFASICATGLVFAFLALFALAPPLLRSHAEQTEIIGTYVQSDDEYRQELVINENGTSVHKVWVRDELTYNVTGQWRFYESLQRTGLTIDRFVETGMCAPPYREPKIQVGSVRESNPATTKFLGKTYLFFCDQSSQFRKID